MGLRFGLDIGVASLEKLHKISDVIALVSQLHKEVLLRDTTNREAQAAKIYFNELMGCSFSSGNENLLLNAGINLYLLE